MLVRSPLLTSHKWGELVSSGRLVCRCHDVFLWCYLCFALLRFRMDAFAEAAALRSLVLRYADAPVAARVSFFFSLLFIWRCRFFRVFFVPFITVFSLYGEYVVRSFLPNGVFVPCDHGLDFSTSAYVTIQSINQSSINQVARTCILQANVVVFPPSIMSFDPYSAIAICHYHIHTYMYILYSSEPPATVRRSRFLVGTEYYVRYDTTSRLVNTFSYIT